MKKLILFCVLCTLTTPAKSACTATTQQYVSCKPGYYMSGTSCTRCPEIGTSTLGTTVYGTGPDYNSGAITSCYAAAGTYYDNTGQFQITAKCAYTTN